MRKQQVELARELDGDRRATRLERSARLVIDRARRAATSPDFLLSVLVAAGVGFGLWETRSWPEEARLVPLFVGLPVLLLAAVQLGREALHAVRGRSGPSADILDLSFDSSVPSSVAMQRGAIFFGWIVGLLLGIWLFGFLIAVPAYVLLYLKTQARASWRLTLVLTASMALLEVGLYDQILSTRWPAAALSDWIPFLP